MTKKVRTSVRPDVPTVAEAAAQPPPPPVDEDDVDMNESMRLFDDEDGGTHIGNIYIPPSVQPHCSSESSGPRLIISEIVNENFKSYAGEVRLGPFYHRFHSVIGPNGSGKSNVIDSMLFVFGYRAKRLRCQKLSTLLHNSAKYPNVSSCRVSVHFVKILDNADGSATPQPGSDFIISRTAFRDNSSFYTIDERRVHFKEVAQLLKKHDVDLDHNRFLILQGEVESIAMMKPKASAPNECGLLEYFEDIIGTSRYKEPLEKIGAEIDKLTEERSDRHNRCKIAEKEMRELLQPKEEATKYLEEENNLTRKVNLHVQKYVSEQLVALRELGEERDERRTALAGHDEQIAAIVGEREAKESTIREERERYDAMARQKLELEQKLKKSLNKFAEVQATMDATNKRRKEWKVQLTKEQAALVEFRGMPEKNGREMEECERKVAQLQAKQDGDRSKLTENAAALEERTAPLLADKEQAETELIGLQQSVDECAAAVKLAENELRLCTEAETTEHRKYETFRLACEDARQSVLEKTERVAVLEQEIAQTQSELAGKQATIQTNARRERDLVQQVQKHRANLEEVQRNAQQARSNDKVLDALMQQKASGQLPGILGRLGDLGGIPAKYDVAISTCCGRLDNIIVDTVKTAQDCIAYLKRSNIGRANFVALEKVAHLAERAARRIQTPENTPRLFDLIHVDDPRLTAAFYFALNDTLVAEDLKHGSRIAYGARRWRVVTLRGDVIETSGSMAGGGNRQIRGKMGEKVKTQSSATAAAAANRSSLGGSANIDELRRSTQELQNEVNYLQEQQGQLERDCAQLQQALRAGETELKRLRLQLAGLEQHLPRQQQQVEQQRAVMERTKADPKRTAQLEANIAASRERLNAAKANTTGLLERVAVANEAVKAINSELVGAIEKRIADQTKQMTTLKKNITKLKVSVSTAERNATKAEAHIVQLADDIKQAEDQLRRDNDVRAQADADSVELTKSIEAAVAALAAAGSDTSATKRAIAALQKREADGQMVRLELAAQLQTAEKKMAEVADSLPHWRNKLRPLKLNVIPTALAGSAEQLAKQEQDERDGILTLKTYTEEELAGYKLEDLQYAISIVEEGLRKQTPNLSVIEEFYRKRVVYQERVSVLEEITRRRTEMTKVLEEVRKKRFNEFQAGFHVISFKLREMYRMITLGGDAELELVDSMDPFLEGVTFSVRPPKKSWKNISNLSGGEKTLSSLALVFALHYYKPSPLYFLDEIDAALDFKNVSIVAHYIKARTKNAQFIIISLRSNMFDLCDYLSGIYKVEDCTKAVTICNKRDENAPLIATGVVTSTQHPEPASQSIVNDPRVEELSMIVPPTPDVAPAPPQRRISGNLFDALRRPDSAQDCAAAVAAEAAEAHNTSAGSLEADASALLDGSQMAVDETVDETPPEADLMMDTSTVSDVV